MTQGNDYPFDEVFEKVKRLAEHGFDCYQKFTCAGCGARLTMDVPNVLYETGTCHECPATTDIRKSGCNYLMHAKISI